MRLQFFLLCLIVASCAKPTQNQGERLYATHCASCHTVPKIDHLTKELWENSILPDMGARMGIQDPSYDPYKGYTYAEQYEMKQSGIYSLRPTISQEDWIKLKDYILANAPDELPSIPKNPSTKTLEQFEFKPISIDSVPGAAISFLGYHQDSQNILIGNLDGSVNTFDYLQGTSQNIFRAQSAVTAFNPTDFGDIVTAVGILNPSEQKEGALLLRNGEAADTLVTGLHRPVHSLVNDFNKDGNPEIVVCEFGHLTGELSLLQKDSIGIYHKRTLIQSPGSMRSIVRDLDGDGKDDIVFMKAQGDEAIMVLYQKDDLTFSANTLLRFSPLMGTSWFEMMDFDGDGDEDIITVHGDNADKTQILKPYHGLRIHLNNGKNEFEESFFYPMYGATRSETFDYDGDGDLDIALVSTFPDYGDRPVKSFVYLENTGTDGFGFTERVLPGQIDGKWFLMKAADVDADGDQDIILSTFTYYFSPIPKDLSQKWSGSLTDLMVLENTLK
ncbi:Repeat domain-containing protein [Flagellimonas taeanensis]|uniref:Repeat domain-containing protein n=1 Tax=Flagellimonas taeanensis TaxID=1005926 RepID=A0A1M6UGY8_9FLAO|nr:Repeat domain-containing protein [Allomuricauda taeanensis]SHK68338.1 Repeat domain-containing protein [Allomuricauda taeanensis]